MQLGSRQELSQTAGSVGGTPAAGEMDRSDTREGGGGARRQLSACRHCVRGGGRRAGRSSGGCHRDTERQA